MIAVGRIGRIFGNDGGVMVTLYANFPDDFSTQEPLFVVIDKLAVPIFCSSFERRGQSGAIISFDDIDSVRRAEEFLVGREIFIADEESDDDDEFYMEDLIGFDVLVDGRKGTLTDYYDSEANPLFEISLDGKEHLIPAAEEFIAHIDFDKRSIKFILPDGLLEL
ncbi:MAG: 16S rRNA processing protein RimM [Alistipes sp.]|jgi:16S rRNA processing protein RimM|nr:16S rRNA processing protein RimM [Alistipes sp.]MBO5971776.1 16S rRNA processing protein RimM [Alistipes sp.]MBO7242262.1 16S rRNA processing protein RimM [Alistipes sp.]